MPIDRELWTTPFKYNRLPHWQCPTCGKGRIVIDKEFQIRPSSENYLEGVPPFDGLFSGILKCNDIDCNESIAISGRAYQKEEWDGYDNGRGELIPFMYHSPLVAIPALHIFSINTHIPKEIRDAIVESFKTFWIDPKSCANKIRSAIEAIMDNQKVKKTFVTKKGKRAYPDLNKRIEIFGEKKAEEAGYLMAIKFIGNSGSHHAEKIKKEDIIDAYDILDHVTKALYDKESFRIKKLSKAIVAKKKPIRAIASIKIS